MFLETIQILDGNPQLVELHNERLNRTRAAYYGCQDMLDVCDIIKVGPDYQAGKVKCRIRYAEKILGVSLEKYNNPAIHTLRIVVDNDVDYSLKYENRESLSHLYHQREEADDIMIIKDDLVTDSYYANLVFYKEGLYYTPKSPLLKGVQRQKLLQEGSIIATDIYKEMINHYDYVTLINAMLSLDEIKIPIKGIK